MGFTHIKKTKGSSYRGVYRSIDAKKFYVKIGLKNGKYISNNFDSELDASKHYLEMRELLYPRNKSIKDDSTECIEEIKKNKNTKKRKKPSKSRKRLCNTLGQSDKKFIHGKARYQCELCKVKYTEYIEGEVDHVIPLQYYGTNNYPNLQSICTSCHKWKCNHLDKIIGKMQENDDYNDKISIIKEVQRKLFEKKFGVNNNTDITINNNNKTFTISIGN